MRLSTNGPKPGNVVALKISGGDNMRHLMMRQIHVWSRKKSRGSNVTEAEGKGELGNVIARDIRGHTGQWPFLRTRDFKIPSEELYKTIQIKKERKYLNYGCPNTCLQHTLHIK